MALFELDDGRIVAAQFGKEVPGGLTSEILNAVRSQVLEIVARPLFPVTWRDFSHSKTGGSAPRLTALDASGQVVAVEVLEVLDAEILIDSLSSLADTASMSWLDLAREYPGNVDGFKTDWAHFRAAMPPSPPNGPRLILVVGSIHPEVRPALDVLSTSGVEVHEMELRQMSNGRAFLSVGIVGPRIYGHRAESLVGDTASLPAIVQGEVKKPPPKKEPEQAVPAAEPPRVAAPVTGRRVVAQRREQARTPFPTRASRRRQQEQATPPAGTLTRTDESLGVLASMVGRPTALALAPGQELTAEVVLRSDGKIQVGAEIFADPTEALQATGVSWMNGWEAWHLGDAYGPTLAEALDEVNRDL